jgi:hypothetical protein
VSDEKGGKKNEKKKRENALAVQQTLLKRLLCFSQQAFLAKKYLEQKSKKTRKS